MNLGSFTVLMGVNTAGLRRGIVDMQHFERSVLGSLGRVEQGLQQMGLAMTQMVTIPVAAAGVAAVKSFSDMESSLMRIITLNGIAGDTVEEWGRKLLTLGPELGQAPAKMAKTLQLITGSGIRGSEALDILKTSAAGATLGLGEMDVVATGLFGAINAYGKGVMTADRVMSNLIGTIREGVGAPQQFVQQLGDVYQIAAQLKVPIEDVNAAVAALTQKGVQVPEAATQVKTFLKTLIQQTPSAERELNALGLSFDTLLKSLRKGGIMNVVTDLDKAITKSGKDVNVVLGDVFRNVRALLPALSFIGPGAADAKKVFGSLRTTFVDFNEILEQTKQTVEYRWKSALASMQSSFIQLGGAIKEPLMAILKDLTQMIQNLVHWFTSLTAEKQKMVLLFVGLAAAIGPVALVLGQVVAVAKTFLGLFGALSGYVGIFIAMGAAIYYIAKNWDLFVQALTNFNWDNLVARVVDTLASTVPGFSKIMGSIKLVNSSLVESYSVWNKYAASVGDAEGNLKMVTEKTKEYNALIKQMKEATTLEERKKIYGQITTVLEEMGVAYKKVVDLDLKQKGIGDTGASLFDKYKAKYEALQKGLPLSDPNLINNEVGKIGKERAAALEAVVKIMGDMREQAERLVKDKDVGFGDLGKKMLADMVEDVTKGINALQQKLTGIDLFKNVGGGGGFGLSELKSSINVNLKALENYAISMMNLPIPDELPLPKLKQIVDPKSYMANFETIDTIFQSTNVELEQHAFLAEKIGAAYDKAGADVTTLQTAISKLSQPELIQFLTDRDLEGLQQYLLLLDKLKTKQEDNRKELTAWKNLFSGLSSLASEVGKYFGEAFQKIFDAFSQGFRIVSDVVRIIRAIVDLTKATAAAEKVKNATTATGVGITLAAAAAEETKAAASTQAAVAGAASSSAWIPIVGVGLAIAGMAALMGALNSHRKKAAKMAQGGIVPDGFPNDSFPAMLSSGETVIPLSKLGSITDAGETNINVKVEGVTVGTDIYYMIKEVERTRKNTFG